MVRYRLFRNSGAYNSSDESSVEGDSEDEWEGDSEDELEGESIVSGGETAAEASQL